MIVNSYKPQPPLSAFVDLLWLEEIHDAPRGKKRVVPTGTLSLVLDLCSRASVAWASTKQKNFHMRGEAYDFRVPYGDTDDLV